MYKYIKGVITEIENNQITLENNNIGYLIKTPTSKDIELNKEYLFHIHQIIKEDSNDLYGFLSLDELNLFRKLLSVKGLGPKTAITILNKNPSEIIKAITSKNNNYFLNFPGIGQKLSNQIITDLKNKFSKTSTVQTFPLEITESLKTLGFSTSEINKAIKDTNINLHDDLEVNIKILLKYLQK